MEKVMNMMQLRGFKFGLKKLVLIDFYSNFLFNFLYMLAQPAIVLYMMTAVDPVWYKITLLINTGGVLVGGWFMKKQRLIWLRHHFTYLCLFDALLMVCINLFLGHLANARFVAIALNEALFTYYVKQIIDDMYNNAFRKSTITLLGAKSNSYSAAGTLTGVGLSVFVTVDIDTALFISSAAIVIDSLVSILLRQRMGSLIKGYISK